MIILYGPRQAPFTEKARRGLVYKGFEFEIVEPEGPDDYKRWSPKTGQLPALHIDGEVIPDSTDILLHLDALRPEPPLLATDPTIAAQQRQLEDWSDESFLFYFLKYRRLVEGVERPLPLRSGVAVEPRTEVSSSPLPRFVGWLRAGGTWERPVTGILRGLGDRMDDLVNFLGGRPFFYDKRLSMADLGVYSMLHIMRNDAIPGSSVLLGQRSSLVAFMTRVEEVTGG